MKKKGCLKKAIACVLTMALVVGSTAAYMPTTNAGQSSAIRVQNDDFTVQKISNPKKGSGCIDGLINGGDRDNSYAWCMTSRGDKLYIGTIRGLGSSMVSGLIPAIMANGFTEEEAISIFDAITNNNFSHDPVTKGGDIISYDTKTGKMDVLMTGVRGESYRMAITYNDDVYIGSYSGTTNYIYRIDADENIEKVYETQSGTSMRAACEFDGNLYFGGVDSSEELTEEYAGAAKLAILQMDKNDPSKWSRVADYSDFEVIYTTDGAIKSSMTSPIWDIVSYNGYIYATLPHTSGFIVYKGRPAVGDETKNQYGWHWEEVVGYYNGINNTALTDNRKGYTGDEKGNLSLTATPFVYKDKLYLMDFDNTFGGMVSTFSNLINMSELEKGEMLKTLYTTLKHPQSLWVLDNKTGKFEKVENFSKLMKDSCNEYLWRTAEYDGELYITTMDSSVIYRYLTQYTDLGLDKDNLDDKSENIVSLAKILKAFKLDESGNEKISKIAKAIIVIGNLIDKAKTLAKNIDIEELTQQFNQLVDFIKNNPEDFMKLLNMLSENPEAFKAIISIFFGSLSYGSKLGSTLGEPATNEGETTEEATTVENEPTTVENEPTTVEATTVADEPTTAESDTTEPTTAEEETDEEWEDYDRIDIREVISELKEKVLDTVAAIDWETLYMYSYIAKRVNNAAQGFDMFKTADGVNFTTVTNDGFGDRYNYGGRTLCPTASGLFIGTSNPFYGAQLFRLNNNKKEVTPATTKESATQAVPTPTTKAKTKKKTTKKTTKKSAKIKAVKKKKTVKKGKTVKIKFKVIGTKAKKKAVRKLLKKKGKKAASIKKIGKIKSVKYKKGKIIVKIKAKKKGTAKLKLKLSKKIKASTKVKIK